MPKNEKSHRPHSMSVDCPPAAFVLVLHNKLDSSLLFKCLLYYPLANRVVVVVDCHLALSGKSCHNFLNKINPCTGTSFSGARPAYSSLTAAGRFRSGATSTSFLKRFSM